MRTLLIKVFAILALFSFLPSNKVHAQQVLDEYIEVGLKNNIVLQQKNISLEKAMLSLQIANGMFSPSLNVLGNFINSVGGRSISFPVGDLLNPVYSTLNQLTGSDNFPQIENVTTDRKSVV